MTFSWQPPHGVTGKESVDSLKQILPRLSTLHVFHWDMEPYAEQGFMPAEYDTAGLSWNHLPLEDGIQRWQAYLETAATTGRENTDGTDCRLHIEQFNGECQLKNISLKNRIQRKLLEKWTITGYNYLSL